MRMIDECLISGVQCLPGQPVMFEENTIFDGKKCFNIAKGCFQRVWTKTSVTARYSQADTGPC